MIRTVLFTRESALLAVLAAIFLVFAVTVDGFLDWLSILDRSRYWVIPGLIAVPMTFIIATAGIDLSVGSMLALSAIVLGLAYQDAHVPIVLAACAAVAAGLAAGAFNGGVSSYLRVPPLVVTLATMALFRGIAMGLSKARPISDFPRSFLWLSQGALFRLFSDGNVSLSFPAPVAALLATGLIGWVLMRRSWVGRFVECIGDNEVAARFAAIDVRRLKFALYTACGGVCGIAALFNTALYATARADAAMGVELEVIACVVIGGTRISGGQGSVLGSLIGLLIIGMLRYGLEMAGVRAQYVTMAIGALLVATAVFNEWITRREMSK